MGRGEPYFSSSPTQDILPAAVFLSGCVQKSPSPTLSIPRFSVNNFFNVRVVIQRVSKAEVTVAGAVVGKIGHGVCLFLGVGKSDGKSNADELVQKIKNLRIFEDSQGKMNWSIMDTAGEFLVVSQFTLYGDCDKGNRPSFSAAAPAAEGQPLYDYFVERLRGSGLKVATGQFQAKMEVSLTNDGPVTLILDR